eukprot:GHVL01004791.1.p1 GENE.GHVL01004791.1~~GHVL01004791.1.p1  ORF type:complete len:187 (-),score=0.19 GHVL01004791.1:609-1169(-)
MFFRESSASPYFPPLLPEISFFILLSCSPTLICRRYILFIWNPCVWWILQSESYLQTFFCRLCGSSGPLVLYYVSSFLFSTVLCILRYLPGDEKGAIVTDMFICSLCMLSIIAGFLYASFGIAGEPEETNLCSLIFYLIVILLIQVLHSCIDLHITHCIIYSLTIVSIVLFCFSLIGFDDKVVVTN